MYAVLQRVRVDAAYAPAPRHVRPAEMDMPRSQTAVHVSVSYFMMFSLTSLHLLTVTIRPRTLDF